MPDLNDQYERKLQRSIARAGRRIQRYYESTIETLSLQIDKVKYNGQVFSLSQFPALKNRIDAQIKQMHVNIYSTVVNSVKGSWDLSNEKNDLLVDKRLARRRPNQRVRKILYDPNLEALNRFTARKEKGLNLSQRVWNSLEPFKTELEAGLGLGITSGRPAKEMARELKKYLVEPDRLFRRVRDAEGKLRLSRPAKAFHPGQGVYRSSYKNSLRLTRTENNIAYRTADHERWKTLPFVIGIEVKLSNQHPKYDICDVCAGRYPKDFKFTGWHPQCICYAVPIMMNDEDYSRLEDSILGIADFDPTSVQQVTETPAGFREFVRQNKNRIEGWSNKPYWVRDNKKYFEDVRREPLPRDIAKIKPAGNAIASQFTKIQPSIRNNVKEALESIDKVHGDGILKDIPFKKVRAQYEAAFFNRNGQPTQIHQSASAKSPAFSLTHEMGHYFDLHTIGTPGQWDSDQDGSRVNQIIKIAKKSNALKAIQKALDDGRMKLNGEMQNLSTGVRNHLNYLLYPKEIWARSYAQYIAKRSGNKSMLAGLKEMVDYKGIPYQWVDEDFSEIEKAIDRLFLDIGWTATD